MQRKDVNRGKVSRGRSSQETGCKRRPLKSRRSSLSFVADKIEIIATRVSTGGWKVRDLSRRKCQQRSRNILWTCFQYQLGIKNFKFLKRKIFKKWCTYHQLRLKLVNLFNTENTLSFLLLLFTIHREIWLKQVIPGTVPTNSDCSLKEIQLNKIYFLTRS
jgi:hypothetical protein